MTADFLPPRQTGRADFPHPVLAGLYCATHSQANESHPCELRVNEGAFRGPPRALAAAAKMPRQAFPHEAVDLPDQLRQWLEAAFLVDHPPVRFRDIHPPLSASRHAGYSVGMMNTFHFIGWVGGAGAPESTDTGCYSNIRREKSSTCGVKDPVFIRHW
jgi:hypothetical protein